MNTNLKFSRLTWLAVLGTLALPSTASACEPAIQLLILYAGPGLFAFGTLGLGVIAKCAVFAFLERDLKRTDAFGYLFLGNVVTTVIGVLMAICLSAPVLALAMIPMVYMLSLAPARRLIEKSGWPWAGHRRASQLARGMVILLLASSILFVLASSALDSKRYALYWLLKLGYIVPGLIISIGLTALWEESVVGRMAARKGIDRYFLTNVVRANYLMFGLALLVMAAQTIPRRLKSEGFLAWLANL